MSPELRYQIARAHQNEMIATAAHAHHGNDMSAVASRPRRSISSRVSQMAAAAGVCLAATTAVTVTGAFASQRPVHSASHISMAQLSLETRTLEHKGYSAYQCTRQGTLLRNPRTGKTALVSW